MRSLRSHSASLGDLHRHSCRHFHFSFLAFFAPSYSYFVSQWISFLSSPPSRARTLLCIFCAYSLSSLFRARFIFLFYSSFLPFFLERAFSFLATQWNMRARIRHREPLALRFSARVLRPCALFEASPSRRSGGREREDLLSTAPREIDELPRDRTERRKENTTKKCKVSRAHSKHRHLKSYAARFQRLSRRRFHWTGKSQFAGCPETGPPTTASSDQNRINNKINDLEKK